MSQYSGALYAAFLLLSTLCYLFMVYLLVPLENHWMRAIAPSMLIVTATVLLLVATIEIAKETIVITIMILIAMNMLGWYTSFVLYNQRRSMFQLYLKEQDGKRLLESNIEMERLLRQVEMDLLQYQTEVRVLCAQIKPHFLANVIQTASNLFRKRPEEADLLLDKLTAYLYHATNADVDQLGVSEELGAVRAFLDIQVARMDGRLSYAINSDYNTDVAVPFCSILTLVENAVQHGLRDCETGGEIIVTVTEKPENLQVSVKDNGEGIAYEKLRGLLDDHTCQNGTDIRRSIGLQNINRRLKLAGSKGLVIKSSLGQGADVSFNLPISMSKLENVHQKKVD
jgi:LytS/YehU family sensor histidine kinase